MLVMAIDPGSARSGWVVYDADAKRVIAAGDDDNGIVCSLVPLWTDPSTERARLVVEWFASHGQASMGAASMIDQYTRGGCKDADLLRRAASMARTGATATGDIATAAMWVGMFCAAACETPNTVARMTRKDVLKDMHVASKGADDAVRAELIRHFGIGSEKKGGDLEKVKGDAWQAMALAVVYAAQLDKDKQADEVIRRGVM
jgi:hypothetical protein